MRLRFTINKQPFMDRILSINVCKVSKLKSSYLYITQIYIDVKANKPTENTSVTNNLLAIQTIRFKCVLFYLN